MDEDSHASEVVFFLGAGASVQSGVPDTYQFVDQFRDYINKTKIGAEEIAAIDLIINRLENWKKKSNSDDSRIDVELLLETLVKFENKDKDPIFQFFDGEDLIKLSLLYKHNIIDHLKNFIKKKGIVSEKQVKPLQGLRDFVEIYKPLDVISVNYDICIEQFCNLNKLIYQDGFDIFWNIGSFNRDNTDIRLYKLHGSIMWYQSDRGNYVKLPIMTEEVKLG